MQKTMSIKLLVIVIISLLLLIPLGMISGKIDERHYFQETAKESVAHSWTGSQTIVGALLVVPYTVTTKENYIDPVTKLANTRIKKADKTKFVLPDALHVEGAIKNDVRKKGIYNIPVYTADLGFSGEVSAAAIKEAIASVKKSHEQIELRTPFVTVMVSDPRGINSIPQLIWQGESLPFKPGSNLKGNSRGIHAPLPPFDHELKSSVAFSFDLSLRGMEDLAFVPTGANVSAEANSSWPHPQFTGAFLPISSDISESGYSAAWQATSFATNIFEKVARCEKNDCEALLGGKFGVKHIETVDIYLQSERSVKYGFLFIGLSFVSFFIFEVLMKLPIHPIQYTLVGAANAIFYLLLISLSEHYPFLMAYLVASICCSLLLFFYLKSVLQNKTMALVFAGAILLLYGVLYVIISMEDFALMMGSLLTFSALAITMFATRNIDWYAVGEQFQHVIEHESGT